MLRVLVSLTLLLTALAGAARADQMKKPATNWLLGDWWGERTRIFNEGVDFQVAYVNEVAHNVLGGTRSMVDYADQVQLGATFDLERLGAYPNALFQVTYTIRTGRNLVDDAQLGNLQLVQEVWGRGQTIRLTEFSYAQKFYNGLFDVKFGRIAMGNDFAAFACDYQNLSFCGSDAGNIVGSYIYNWPISQWGARVKVNIEGFGYVQGAIYDQNSQYLGLTDQLLPVWYPGSTGALIPFEIGWLPTLPGGLAGSYKIGAWYSSNTASDVILDVNGGLIALTGLPPMQRKGLYGGYINFQQQITRNSSPNPRGGLNAFLNLVVSDQWTSTTDRQMAAGFTYTGPFTSRPDDAIGFAAGATHVNSRIGNVQVLTNSLGMPFTPVQSSEWLMELYYTFQPTPGMVIRPNLQFIMTPGGTSQNLNVFVLGLKTIFQF